MTEVTGVCGVVRTCVGEWDGSPATIEHERDFLFGPSLNSIRFGCGLRLWRKSLSDIWYLYNINKLI